MFGKKAEAQKDLLLYVIYDSKVDAYRDPIFSENDEVLLRSVVNEFTDPRYARTDMFLNAEDFTIFSIGYYQRKTGSITLSERRHVANVIELRTQAWKKMSAQDGVLKGLQVSDSQRINQIAKDTKVEGH
jgi:hypothetical protein